MVSAKALMQECIVPQAMIYSRGHLDSGGTNSLNVRMTHSIIPWVIGPTLSHSQGPLKKWTCWEGFSVSQKYSRQHLIRQDNDSFVTGCFVFFKTVTGTRTIVDYRLLEINEEHVNEGFKIDNKCNGKFYNWYHLMPCYKHMEYLWTVKELGKCSEKAEKANKREIKAKKQRENGSERESFSAGHQYSSITSCLSQLIMSPRSQETGAW